MDQKQVNQKLFSMLKRGVSPFHVVNYAQEQLEEAGFKPLNMTETWGIENGGTYYINHNDSTLIAIRVGEKINFQSSFRIAAGHTDVPCLSLKPNPEINANGYQQVNVEVYGGAILNTWLDRPLSIAGKVALRSDNPFKPEIRLFDAKDKILYIPNLAIHMNREVNKGVELKKQSHMLPMVGMVKEKLEEKNFMMKYLAKKLKCKVEDILDYELFVYCADEPEFVGIDKEFISSPRLDDLTSVQAMISAIIEGGDAESIQVAYLANHEEIGSRTKQGAASMFLNHVLEKMMMALGRTPEQTLQMMYGSILLSMDVAHALHPSYAAKMDVTNKPVMNKGFIIKEACSQSYATDCEAVGIIRQLCDEEKIPYQKFVNNSDAAGGGTLGSIASALLPVKTIDVGVPMLAMHSARECMGAKDQKAFYDLTKAFFSRKG